MQEMTNDELEQWITLSLQDYIEDRMRSGEQPEVARRTAETSFSNLFPAGRPKENHVVRKAVDAAGSIVGYLWIGPENDGPESAWWVWDIVVVEEHRSRGYGRQIMNMAEQESKMRAGETLGLHVFGFNKIARELYESMGYETTSIRMSKKL